MTARARILFLDRDGTLIEEPPDEQVDHLEELRLLPGVIPALLALRDAGYRFVVVTNQDGLGTLSYPEADYRRVQGFLEELLRSQGIELEAVLVCPHRAEDRCACRKPATGLVAPFLARTPLDPERSFVIGDRESDLELARNLGLTGLRVRLGGRGDETWSAVAARILAGARAASVTRRTRETEVTARIDLAREAPVAIATGLAFLDHMLEQVARHGGFALELSASGDLAVDEHHTVEDCALVLGEALRQALGDKRGLARYGFVLPMDEARAEVLLDLSGRPCAVWNGTFPRERVGELPTELVPHFFRSLAEALGAAVHVGVRGENAHHMVEACFKGLGRALRQAVARAGSELPSSKGTL